MGVLVLVFRPDRLDELIVKLDKYNFNIKTSKKVAIIMAGNIPLVEDGACAAGAAYKGIPAGGLGTIGCFSFHSLKNMLLFI